MPALPAAGLHGLLSHPHRTLQRPPGHHLNHALPGQAGIGLPRGVKFPMDAQAVPHQPTQLSPHAAAGIAGRTQSLKQNAPCSSGMSYSRVGHFCQNFCLIFLAVWYLGKIV